MSDYDPRTETGIPTEPVGSLPRPSTLQAAYAAYDKGEIDKAALEKEQDAAVEDSIKHLEATGSPIISDGEQRWSSFATYALADTLAGTGLADNLAGGGQFFAIFADGHNRQLPKLTGGPFRYKTYAADTLKRSIGYAPQADEAGGDRPVDARAALPPAGGGRRLRAGRLRGGPGQRVREGHPAAFAAGAVRVSVDFTEGRLATRADPRNPWTGAGMLPHFIELNNRVMARFTADERRTSASTPAPVVTATRCTAPTCPTTTCCRRCSRSTPGYFLIQLASERDKDPVYESIGQHSRDDADGVAQMCFVGVINPGNPRVESPEEVRDALVRAANFIPKERLGSTDDCGFSPFSIDEKPNHGSPDYAREVAFQKIANRVEGTKMAAEKLGVS